VSPLPDDDEPEDAQRPLSLAVLKRLFGYTKPHARVRNWLMLSVLLRAIQLPISTWVVARVIGGPIASGDFRGAAWGVLGFVAFELGSALVFVHRTRLALVLGEAVVHDLRNDLHRHMMSMPISFFQKRKVGRLISRMTSDVDAVRGGVQDVFFIGFVQSGTALIAACLMAYYDWLLFLMVLALVPILASVVQYFRARLMEASRQVQKSFSRVTGTLAESVTGIRVIQGFVRERFNEGLFSELIGDHAGYNMTVSRFSARMMPLLELNGQIFLALLLAVGGARALEGHVALETVIQFLFLSSVFFGAVPTLGNQYNNALTAMAGAERVFSLLDTQPEWQDKREALSPKRLEGHVELRDVTLEYVPGLPVLHGISLVVSPGQMVALVGPTGSGKSSLVKLIGRLYLPTSGSVLIDGVDTRELAGQALTRFVGTVPQDNFLFTGSVRDNIRLGRPEASDQEVEDAVRALGMWDVFLELEHGLETQVGEGGGNLSLGQRQIVCFARALLPDPRIIILDEATSSVDAVTEARLQVALKKLLAGRTSFIVAHRLSTIRHADIIVLLDHGRVSEVGNHEQLLARGGAYAELHRQFIGA
jgi:ATP-binding cassette subfamily B protein